MMPLLILPMCHMRPRGLDQITERVKCIGSLFLLDQVQIVRKHGFSQNVEKEVTLCERALLWQSEPTLPSPSPVLCRRRRRQGLDNTQLTAAARPTVCPWLVSSLEPVSSELGYPIVHFRCLISQFIGGNRTFL